MNDTPRHRGMRMQMVERLLQQADYSPAVMDAMLKVPRHLFMDPSFEAMAYDENKALDIACEQTISRPSTVALQTHCLHLEPGMKVMEIGTGSGYQTAILCAMGVKVFTIERQRELFERAQRLFRELHIRPQQAIFGDGYLGATWKDYAPFDRILVTCGATEIPPVWVEQLKVGGIMVIPLNDQMTLYRKTEGEPEVVTIGTCNFVPMLKNTQ